MFATNLYSATPFQTHLINYVCLQSHVVFYLIPSPADNDNYFKRGYSSIIRTCVLLVQSRKDDDEEWRGIFDSVHDMGERFFRISVSSDALREPKPGRKTRHESTHVQKIVHAIIRIWKVTYWSLFLLQSSYLFYLSPLTNSDWLSRSKRKIAYL